jgi:hypothetical protein
MKIINQSKKILDKLRKEGKVTEVNLTPEQIAEWQEQMFKIKEESRIKQNNSWQSAKDIWLD